MRREEAVPAALRTRAPAKVNLTLHILGRRADGYHALESLVVFAGVADHLELVPGEGLSLHVEGPTAAMAGPSDDNLVLRAARALMERRPGLVGGSFRLTKRLPAAAGIGGGSSDAAAALRLLARANGLPPDDPDVLAAARATGADIPVCLDPRARMMRGAGEEVGPPLALPRLHAVLVNPGVAVPTPSVFKAIGLKAGEAFPGAPHPPIAEQGAHSSRPPHAEVPAESGPRSKPEGASFAASFSEAPQDEDVVEWMRLLASARNDLEPPALMLAPAIGEALARLRATDGCRLARMSGSGATVFGLYADCHAAARAARAVRAAEPGWWVKPTVLR